MTAASSFAKVSPHLFENKNDPAVVSSSDIEAVISAAKKAPDGRARILLHPDRKDSLHEMIIALPPTSCDHPHINFRSGKSFLALSGRFALMRFSDDASRIDPVILSAGPWPGALMARLCAPAWHTIIPLEGDTVFLETNLGPFSGNRFAPWFPQEDKRGEREDFVQRLRLLARTASERLEVR